MAKKQGNRDQDVVSSVVVHTQDQAADPRVSVVVDVTLDKEDLLAVGLAEAETYMANQLDSFKKLRSSLQQESVKLDADITAATDAAGKSGIKSVVNKFSKLAREISGGTDKDLSVAISKPTLEQLDDGSYSVLISFEVNCSGNDGSARIYKHVYKPAPAALVAMVQKRESLKEQINQASEEALAWQRRLGNMSMLERQIRAQVAKSRLQTTAEGQHVLNAIRSDLLEKVKALPCR